MCHLLSVIFLHYFLSYFINIVMLGPPPGLYSFHNKIPPLPFVFIAPLSHPYNSIYVYLCVCISTCMYIYIYVCVFMYIYICAYIYTYLFYVSRSICFIYTTMSFSRFDTYSDLDLESIIHLASGRCHA